MLALVLLLVETVSFWHARNVFDEAAAEGARVAAAFDGSCAAGTETAACVDRTTRRWLVVRCRRVVQRDGRHRHDHGVRIDTRGAVRRRRLHRLGHRIRTEGTMSTSATHRDAGFVGAVEVVYLGIAALVMVVFLGYLGRLSAAGVQVTNAAQDASRAASIAGDPEQARSAAEQAASRSGLAQRCIGDPSVSFAWEPSDLGTWQGALVTVTVSCTVANQSLTGIWTPGVRTVTVNDQQVVERFRR